jgi:serine/threonine-protein kinase
MESTVRAPAEDPLVGRVIAGRFVLERRLGKGGMGVVYLANHNVLKRMFAVKLLRREFVSNERALARFFREARVASSVDHPNIVSIYDYGQTDKGEPYLVMEYVEGTLLYLAVVDSPTHNLTPLAVVDIALQVARALEHAHERGVVHRDIKPENILLTTWNGQADWVKVLDFGVARIVGQPPLTRIGEEIIGTPEFIAPEMMSATADVAPSVDLYALGIMMHDTIVGEPPFRGEIKDVLHGHLNVVPPRLSERRPEVQIPSELDELTAQLLEKTPSKRPTAAETVRRLEHIRTIMPTRTRPGRLHEQPTQQVSAVRGSSSWNGQRTLILGPESRGGEQLQGATTLVLPALVVEAAKLSEAPPTDPGKLGEIEALVGEIENAVARLGEQVDVLGRLVWPADWPAEARALRDHLVDCQNAEEQRGLRVAVLAEQLQSQMGRLNQQRQELRQQILGLSERLQLERNLGEAERKSIQRAIEEKERALGAVLQSAPTSPEPALNHIRRELHELREDSCRGWQKLAHLALTAAGNDHEPERQAIETLLKQISAAQAMLTLLTRPGRASATT